MLHKESRQSILLSVVLIAISLACSFFMFRDASPLVHLLINGPSFLFLGFILQFFRNPSRPFSSHSPTLINCPADGKIVVIEEKEETEYLHQKCIQVSIFMSPMNVHVNRNPVSGTVEYSAYHPGKYLMAWNPKSSTDNERTSIVYKLDDGRKVMMKQIAGFLARRIVNYLKEEDKVTQGEDMGFIKLGSRVDLLLPLDADIKVELGQIVKGNITTIAEI